MSVTTLTFFPISKPFSIFHIHTSISLRINPWPPIRRRMVSKASHSAHLGLAVQDDFHAFLEILPCDLRNNLLNEPKRAQLLEVIYPQLCERGQQYLPYGNVEINTSPNYIVSIFWVSDFIVVGKVHKDAISCVGNKLKGKITSNLFTSPIAHYLNVKMSIILKVKVILDLGRLPEARYLGDCGGKYLRDTQVSMEELEYAQNAVGEFGGDNRAGIEGTLHRISAIRSRNGVIVGLTCRVGRAVSGHVDMIRDLLPFGESILFVGRPGVGKTTVMREIARVLSDELNRRVVIVDTSNEIGGDGDIPHAAIGGARRMQVPEPSMQHRIMIEAVENHMPEVIIVDEIGTEAEALACRSIAERGIMLIGTAHGERLENIIKNPTLSDLVCSELLKKFSASNPRFLMSHV
ncbi:Uncharacterized protein ycf45 [Vitis vinifera]|uniref:Uncharacterized protein ycf45 n=1 Tax=Vitis vinifera TaxID=29760 RepID=A0A438CA74_VITVI|nr:Uncharacterized protein ycf45 [Vitis vinifera]